MIVPAITLALALLVVVGIWSLLWQIDIQTRFLDSRIAYEVRVATREPMPTQADYNECLNAVARIEAERLGGQLESSLVRAYDAVELALAPAGLRVVR